MYVCWNTISPESIGIYDNSAEFLGIETIEYCEDEDDNPFKYPYFDNLMNCGDLCPLDRIIDTVDPYDVIGYHVCPNGETVTRFIKFCTPPGEDGVGGYIETNETPGISGYVEFCDFGDRDVSYSLFPDVQLPPPPVQTGPPTSFHCYIYHEELDTNRYRFEWAFLDDDCNRVESFLISENLGGFTFDDCSLTGLFGIGSGDVFEYSPEIQECSSITLHASAILTVQGGGLIFDCEAVATSQKKLKDDVEKDANVFRVKKKIDLVAEGKVSIVGTSNTCSGGL